MLYTVQATEHIQTAWYVVFDTKVLRVSIFHIVKQMTDSMAQRQQLLLIPLNI